MVKLTYPFHLISKDNFKCRNKSGRYFLSEKYSNFEKKIKVMTKMQYRGNPLIEDLIVIITAYFKDRKHSDTGNLSKSVLDALQGCIYGNDRQIKELTIKVFEGVPEEKFTIEFSNYHLFRSE